MNKYEKYLDMREFFDAVLFGTESSVEEYYRKRDIKSKIHFYTEFRNSLLKVIDTKLENEDEEKTRLMSILKKDLNSILNIKTGNTNKRYSDSDIEFLRQFSGFNLTLEEACLVGKRDEYYDYLRLVNYKMGNLSRKLDRQIRDEIKRLNGDYTPRLIWSFYNKHKGRKN